MKPLMKLAFLFFFIVSITSFAGSNTTARIYTICQRKLCLTTKPEDLVSFRNRIPGNVSGYFEPDTATLFEVYDSLMEYLSKSVDLSKCKYHEYKRDDIVFSFYEYYLQFVPFCDGQKKMIYIKAYRRGYDKADKTDESPATRIVEVFDGGSNFWNIMYDVEEERFFGLSINGES